MNKTLTHTHTEYKNNLCILFPLPFISNESKREHYSPCSCITEMKLVETDEKPTKNTHKTHTHFNII